MVGNKVEGYKKTKEAALHLKKLKKPGMTS
jgi:hypothetical protein